MPPHNDDWPEFADAGKRIGFAAVVGIMLLIITSVVTLRFIRQIPDFFNSLKFSSSRETIQSVSKLLLVGSVFWFLAAWYVSAEYGQEHRISSNITYRSDPASVDWLTAIGGAFIVAAAVLYGWNEFSARFKRPEPVFTAEAIKIMVIRIPGGIRYRHEGIHQFMQGLLSTFPHLMLQIRGEKVGVTWRIADTRNLYASEQIERYIHSSYPDAQINYETHAPADQSAPFYRYVSFYRLGNEFTMPMQYLSDFREIDPLSAIAEAMSDLQPDEQVIYTVGLLGLASDAYAEGLKLISRPAASVFQLFSLRGVQQRVGQILTNNTRVEKYQARDQRVMEEKLRDVLYRAAIIIQADASTPERVRDLIAAVEMQLGQFTRMPYNGLAWLQRDLSRYMMQVPSAEADFHTDCIAWHNTWQDTYLSKRNPAVSVFSLSELAALWHLPTDKIVGTNVEFAPANVMKMPRGLAHASDGGNSQSHTVIGYGKFQNREVPVKIPLEDRRTHINIIGKTGMGKSNLMHHMIHQDIASGQGVAVIDPHGTLIQAILEASIPEERENDIVLLDLTDQGFPPPINPMRGNLGTVGIGRVMSIFERLYDDVDQYVRLAKYLQAAIGLLAEDDTPTMRDISRVFTDDPYRHNLLNQTENPFVLDVWETYEMQSNAQRRQIHEPILSRIAPFYGNPVLYPVLCHPQALNFRRFIEDKKIVLVSLAMADDLVSERERNLIGALLVSMLQMAGMQKSEGPPFYVYVDEVQKFVTTSLDVVLSEARKFGLSLTIANQYLGQLTGRTLEAVMGNVGTHIVFRPGSEDAKSLGVHMRPQFQGESLVSLDRYTAATKLQNEGAVQPAFTLYAPPPLEKTEDAEAQADRLRKQAIEQARLQSKAEIMAWLKDRYPRRKFGVEEPVQDYD